VINLIDVCQHSRAFTVLRGPGYSWASPYFMLECYIGVIFDHNATEYSVGCPPVTGDPNVVGDRSCHHYNWTGTLDILPADTFVTAYRRPGSQWTYPWPWYILGTGSTAQSFSILSRYGESGHSFFTQTRRNSKDALIIQSIKASWHWEDDGKVMIMHLVFYDDEFKSSFNVSSIIRFDNRPTQDNLNFVRVRQGTNVVYNDPTGSIFDDTYPLGLWRPPSFTAVTSEKLDLQSKPAIQRALWDGGERIEQSLRSTPKEMWGDLTDVAVQNARSLDINTFEYARDLYNLRESCEAILKLLRGKPDIKKLADAWLTFKYGFRLTILDSKSLGEALGRSITQQKSKKNYSVCRAMDTSVFVGTRGPIRDRPVSEQYNLKIYYSPDSDKFLSLCRVLMNWDTFPSLQNVWDLIPLSFVIDWFTDFSRTLERIDTNTYINTVDVISTIQTRKSSIQAVPVENLFFPGGAVWSGCLDLDIYSRNLSDHLTLPLLRLGSPEKFHNIAELTSIIIQRKRRR